jgi:glycosyltransferase involved in cell wall biosynthesis
MISACLIAKNEEKWIGECLEHLKPLVTELIVVDTGSQDRTMEIAREKGARVSQIKWENDFSKARNVSLEKATQRWILIIDPDERISPRDFDKIKALTEKKDVMGFTFRTRNYSRNTLASGYRPCSKEYPEEKDYPGYFESPKVRLFQNIPSTRFVGSVHELVESTIQGKIEDSDVPFHHYGNTPEVETEKGKKNFYQNQGKKKIKENPNDWKSFFELGVEYLSSGEFQKAYRQLERARDLRPRDPLIMSNLGYAYMESGLLEKGELVLRDCLQVDANYHDALLNLGVIQMRRGNWQGAISIFDQAAKAHPFSFLSFRNRGLCYAHLKSYQAAAASFEKAIGIFPQFTDARIDLGVVCFAAGRPDIAKPILEEALRADPKSLRARTTLDDVDRALASRR